MVWEEENGTVRSVYDEPDGSEYLGNPVDKQGESTSAPNSCVPWPIMDVPLNDRVIQGKAKPPANRRLMIGDRSRAAAWAY